MKQKASEKKFYITPLEISVDQEQSQADDGTTEITCLIKETNITGAKMTKDPYLFTCPGRKLFMRM